MEINVNWFAVPLSIFKEFLNDVVLAGLYVYGAGRFIQRDSLKKYGNVKWL